jgi:hypothetical protein
MLQKDGAEVLRYGRDDYLRRRGRLTNCATSVLVGVAASTPRTINDTMKKSTTWWELTRFTVSASSCGTVGEHQVKAVVGCAIY